MCDKKTKYTVKIFILCSWFYQDILWSQNGNVPNKDCLTADDVRHHWNNYSEMYTPNNILDMLIWH